jgi:hypothetical protein
VVENHICLQQHSGLQRNVLAVCINLLPVEGYRSLVCWLSKFDRRGCRVVSIEYVFRNLDDLPFVAAKVLVREGVISDTYPLSHPNEADRVAGDEQVGLEGKAGWNDPAPPPFPVMLRGLRRGLQWALG